MPPVLSTLADVLLRRTVRMRHRDLPCANRRDLCCCTLALVIAASGVAQQRLILNGGDTLSTLAGSGKDGRSRPGSAASMALGHPQAVMYDSAANLYISDSRNHQVLRLTPDGDAVVFAGTGSEGFSGDGAAATAANLSHPGGLAFLADGTLLIADTGNHRIRSVSPGGTISTIAGIAHPGNSGDGGPAVNAALRRPGAVLVDASGSVIIADTGNHRIRRISASGIMEPLAGTGTEGDEGDGGPARTAAFRSPSAMALLPDGRILVADASAHRVRSLERDGTVRAYAPQAGLRRPVALGMSPNGDLLVADAALQQVLDVAATGSVSVAGSGMQGVASPGLAWASSLDSPSGLTADASGNLVLSDRRNHRVQRVAMPALTFGSVPAGQQSAPLPLLVQNGGSRSLQVVSIALPAGFLLDPGGACPPPPFSLAAQQQCDLSVVFAPTAQGPLSGLLSVASDGAPVATTRVSGVATAPASLTQSQTSMSLSGTISYAGSPLQLTASVTGSLRNAPTGNIRFMDANSVLSTVPLNGATASFATSALLAGNHNVHASYSGDSVYAASDSAMATVSVVAAPDFTLSSAAASVSAKPSGAVAIPMTVLPINGTLNHSVTMTVSGLPTGFSAACSPPVFTLAGNPVQSTITITVPATVAAVRHDWHPAFASVLLLVPFAFRRRRPAALLALSVVGLVTSAGCGGFRTASTTGSSSSTFKYNATITATTTGVLGDTLTHSIPLELVITP